MLKKVILQNFRSYKKSSFEFSDVTTVIVGQNTAGKTNIIEAIYFFSHGKSFRTEKYLEAIKKGEEFAKISADTFDNRLEVILSGAGGRISKRLLVNGISRRRLDFVGNLPSVIFSPQDLDLISGSPSTRRSFLDEILEQTDREYRLATISYEKALRHRNALLGKAKDSGIRNEEQFEYWDRILIESGRILTKKREEFILFLDDSQKEILEFSIFYDKSVISSERLDQYREAEKASGLTLVGPHRDDFLVSVNKEDNLKSFGSRGQQRLGVLQLKLLQLDFMEKRLNERPLLLLDDIFSELDSEHINLVVENIKKQQTIITTTHKEFLSKKFLKNTKVIELKNAHSTDSGHTE